MEFVEDIVTWFTQPENQIFLWIVIGVAAIAVLVLILVIVAKFLPLGHHKEFPVDGREANLLALGFQQTTNSGNYWNDPTASELAGRQLEALREMWGLQTSEDVYENVERLTTVRRRRELWQQLLAIRAEAAAGAGGKRPSSRQWLAAIKAAGGTGKGDERDFVNAVHYYEKHLGKKGRVMYPADEPVTSFDGYALGQAVAVATWGVGAGLIERAEAQRLIEETNLIARAEFGSWAAFGRSYALGRAMHWSDGTVNEKRAEQAEEAADSMIRALDGKRRGPWGLLPWRI